MSDTVTSHPAPRLRATNPFITALETLAIPKHGLPYVAGSYAGIFAKETHPHQFFVSSKLHFSKRHGTFHSALDCPADIQTKVVFTFLRDHQLIWHGKFGEKACSRIQAKLVALVPTRRFGPSDAGLSVWQVDSKTTRTSRGSLDLNQHRISGYILPSKRKDRCSSMRKTLFSLSTGT